MKRVCILGPIDKRVLVYPLIKVLELTGKTLVVTDDACFRRFAPDLGLDFECGQAKFVIRPKVNEGVLTEVGLSEDAFDYVVYVTTDELILNCDSTVYCHGVNKSMLSEDNLEFLGDIKYKEIIISPNKIPEKEENSVVNPIKVNILKDMLHYVFTCEENRSFMYQTKAGSLLPKIIANVFEDSLGISAETIAKLLERKE